MPLFQEFPKLTRFSHDWVVTEKIDGTNAQIYIEQLDSLINENPSLSRGTAPDDDLILKIVCAGGLDYAVMAGSRNRMLSRRTDNHGWAKFVQENAEVLYDTLGVGRHFGEWFGLGIGKRQYDLKEKRFALFNVSRWANVELPPQVMTAPVLFEGYLADSTQFGTILSDLRQKGSRVTEGFMNPEGIVMFHRPSQTLFKKTFDYDELGKWAEKEERRGNN